MMILPLTPNVLGAFGVASRYQDEGSLLGQHVNLPIQKGVGRKTILEPVSDRPMTIMPHLYEEMSVIG